MKISYLYYLIYMLIAFLHIFIVKNNVMIIFIVIIFELTRLVALLNKAKPIIFCLAIFSSIFIILNYKATFEVSEKISLNRLYMISNINKYTEKYWLSANNLQKLLDTQNTNMNHISSLPHWLIIATLVVLVELSLAYMVSQNTSTEIKGKKIKGTMNIKEPIRTMACDNNIQDLTIVDGKYFKGKKEISKSQFYKIRKRDAKQKDFFQLYLPSKN